MFEKKDGQRSESLDEIGALRTKMFDSLGEFRKRNGVSLVNPFDYARSLGITVLSTNTEDYRGLLGYYICSDGKKDFIYVSKDVDMVTSRQVVAVGIGRFFITSDSEASDIYDISGRNRPQTEKENLGDVFAREMLMPDEEFIEAYKQRSSLDDCIPDLSDHFGVEKDWVQAKIADLELKGGLT